MNRPIIIILLIHLKVLYADGQTVTKEEFSKREISNIIPDTNFITVLKDSVLTGQVISICDGYSGHSLEQGTIGVIKIKPSQSETIYSVLTPHYKKSDYKVGAVVEILIAPLTKMDNYYRPGTITCEGIKGDKICLLKE